MIEESIKHIEDRIKFSDLRPEIVIKKESAEAVLKELENYKSQKIYHCYQYEVYELSKELETWKKIAYKLAEELAGNGDYIQNIIEWARKEVKK